MALSETLLQYNEEYKSNDILRGTNREELKESVNQPKELLEYLVDIEEVSEMVDKTMQISEQPEQAKLAYTLHKALSNLEVLQITNNFDISSEISNDPTERKANITTQIKNDPMSTLFIKPTAQISLENQSILSSHVQTIIEEAQMIASKILNDSEFEYQLLASVNEFEVQSLSEKTEDEIMTSLTVAEITVNQNICDNTEVSNVMSLKESAVSENLKILFEENSESLGKVSFIADLTLGSPKIEDETEKQVIPVDKVLPSPELKPKINELYFSEQKLVSKTILEKSKLESMEMPGDLVEATEISEYYSAESEQEDIGDYLQSDFVHDEIQFKDCEIKQTSDSEDHKTVTECLEFANEAIEVLEIEPSRSDQTLQSRYTFRDETQNLELQSVSTIPNQDDIKEQELNIILQFDGKIDLNRCCNEFAMLILV